MEDKLFAFFSSDCYYGGTRFKVSRSQSNCLLHHGSGRGWEASDGPSRSFQATVSHSAVPASSISFFHITAEPNYLDSFYNEISTSWTGVFSCVVILNSFWKMKIQTIDIYGEVSTECECCPNEYHWMCVCVWGKELETASSENNKPLDRC